MRSLGMKIRVYVDTNIYVYAILHHPAYGESCAEILRDIARRTYEAYGSTLVAIELLGSLSRIDPQIARRALEDYLSLDIILLNVSLEALRLAAIINEVTNARYDSIHAALVLLNDIPVVITNDLDDWGRISRSLDRIMEEMKREGYETRVEHLQIVSPRDYRKWRRTIVSAQS